VTHLGGHPRGEVVAVRGGNGAVAEEVSVRVVEDRSRRHLLESLEQFALVGGAMVERLTQLDAAGEDERTRYLGHGLSPCAASRSGPRRAAGKRATPSPSGSAPPRGRHGSPVSALTSVVPGPAAPVFAVPAQSAGRGGAPPPPRRARSRGTTISAAPP